MRPRRSSHTAKERCLCLSCRIAEEQPSKILGAHIGISGLASVLAISRWLYTVLQRPDCSFLHLCTDFSCPSNSYAAAQQTSNAFGIYLILSTNTVSSFT